MNAGQRAADALDIVQTRAFTAQEKREVGHLWEKVIWRGGAGRLHAISFYLWYAFAAFMIVSVLMAVKALDVVKPDLALQLAVAAAGFAFALGFNRWVTTRLHLEKHWSIFDAGDRYALQADGIQKITRRGRFSCNWENIETIINDGRTLVAVLPGNAGLVMIKAAFEGQDVESFGAELVRRWQASRDAVRPESSP
ncbi:hypothetical protein [Dongia deserti]|uniref:hypothetical protein n=1 Tax=Dongia deserti TaxID=2268030 RepID=UPI0013C4B433|nr:hypothetical protein [Dongia deserti]